MNNDARLNKNLAIKEKCSETRLRHKEMLCRVITVKVVRNKLSRIQKEQLYGQFREAKWVYNSILNKSQEGEDIFTLTYKDFETVTHKDKDKNDIVDKLQYISKRELQSVIAGIKTNISNLAKAKKKGIEVGALKFISDYNSLDLAQYEKSYKVLSKTKIKVDKVKKPLYVRGLEQLYNLDVYYEFANAKLLKKPDGLYVAITIYMEKEHKENDNNDKPLIGIDMGCETSLTLSDGRKINVQVKETERLKRLQRGLDRCKKGSHNRRKVCRKLGAEYQHLSNKRDDMSKKILHMLSSYRVVMQDEQLSTWMANGHGDKISHGVLGRVKNGLLSRDDTFVLSQWIPTTKMCTCCGNSIDITLRDRVFVCPVCGCKSDRDVHAAKNMLWFYGKRETLRVERTEYNREAFCEGIRDIFGRPNHETTKSSV